MLNKAASSFFKGGVIECSSRMTGNCHVRFLEGWPPAMGAGYSAHRVFAETWCRLGTCLQAIRILTLEPEHLKKRTATTGTNHPRWKVLTRDAQAVCNFSFSASKSSPFFQSVSVMAAILRASVSRAMVGLMPLSREA